MAAGITINALTNAAIYMLPQGLPTGGGIPAGGSGLGGLLGRASEIELPHPKHKTIDYKALGLLGTPELWSGIDKLEMAIKWASYDPAVLGVIPNPTQTVAIQVMADMQQVGSLGIQADVPVIYLASGWFKDAGKASLRQHEQVEVPTSMAVWHCELYIQGVQQFLFDVMSNSYLVNGVDIFAQYRANQGGQ